MEGYYLGLGLRKKVLHTLWMLVLITSLFSCDSDRQEEGRTGSLRLTLAADTTSLKSGVPAVKTIHEDEFAKFLIISDYKIGVLLGEDTVKYFSRFDQMPAEIELKEGTYSLVAYKGNNLPAAFENPYFEGSASFTVKQDMVTPIDVTCTLGNARITVDYTEDFKEAYTDYRVELGTAFTGANRLKVSKEEVRPAYMQIAKEGSEMEAIVYLKKTGEDTEKPYSTKIAVERRQNVRLIFKTDGAAQDGIGLDVLLDNEMTNITEWETIPDFMWQQFEKPKLEAVNFTEDGFSVSAGQSNLADMLGDPNVGFNVAAGIRNFYIDRWIEGQEDTLRYDLATDKGLADAKAAGFVLSQELNDKMNLYGLRGSGQLYLSDVISKLEPSDREHANNVYHFRFQVSDTLPKTNYSNILKLKVNVKSVSAPNINFLSFPASVIEGVPLKEKSTAVLTSSTGFDEQNGTTLTISKMSPQEETVYNLCRSEDRTRLSAQSITVTEEKLNDEVQIKITFGEQFTMGLTAETETTPGLYTYKIDLKEKDGNRTDMQSRTIEVHVPDFTMKTGEGDAFAKRIFLYADMSEGNKDKLKFQYKSAANDWTDVEATNFKYDDKQALYVNLLKGLTPTTDYMVRAVYNGKWNSAPVTVTTEKEELTLPNAGFGDWSIGPDGVEGAKNDIRAVGTTKEPFRYWEIWQPWAENDDASIGWNTLNLETTKDGKPREGLVSATTLENGGFPWTRYTANSGTIRTEGNGGGYAALIRTVGWGVGTSASGSASIIKNCTPGELFLGTCKDTEPVYGQPFKCRPTGFSFDYKFENPMQGNDSFIAEIILYANDGSEIVRKTVETSDVTNSWTNKRITVDYTGIQGRIPASKMCIRFVSGKVVSTKYADFPIQAPNTNLSTGEYVGSQLSIDNVQLFYE